MVRKKTMRFLALSVVLVSVLCITVFGFLALFMNKRSSEAIEEIGTIYMTGMSEQITLHFETTIDLRLSQVSALQADVSVQEPNQERIREELAYSAKARGFDYLAFYSRDGIFEMIYGEPVEATDPEPFLESLTKGEKKVAVGTDSEGEVIVLLGVPAEYFMEDGKPCIALVAALPVDYIKEVLSLDNRDSLVYSHIIRRDGSFVIRSEDIYQDNYFDRIRSVFKELDGKNAERYVEELSSAMDSGKSFSSIFEIGEERRHLYCMELPYSEWYLVTVMPYGELDESVRGLNQMWSCMNIGSCFLVLLVLLWVFYRYFGLTRKQLQELETARQEAVDASKAKSEFLSNMSHDIRTPMNAIVGMTAIALSNLQNTQQVENCLKKITMSGRHLLGLINDVLDMSRIESGKMTLNMERISLREVVESIVNIVQPQANEKNQQFDVLIQNISEENVYCDSVRLNQVFLNFLSNAVKFTPEGGTILVSMSEEASPRGEDFIRAHIRIKDNGIGMSPEFIEKIFESFAREDRRRVHKTQGTGLGMAITKYIVDAMGGTIEVQSEQGKGSEFHVTLDLEKAEASDEEIRLPAWDMLIVDDDEQLCQSAVDTLASVGVKAEWTLDGESAVRMIENRHEQQNDFQVILLDWKLPGMNGIETARVVRTHLGDDIPILLISAYDWSDIEEEARGAGVNGFISKPLFKSTLLYGLRPYAEGTEAEPGSQEEDTGLIGKRILLAEDNDLNWEIAEELLSEVGMELDRAENGQVCVEMFQKSEIGFYDAILMDIRMPVMTGYEATEAIRALDREDSGLPVIAMTADAFSEDVQRCLDCGMNAHVSKPIDVQIIVNLLKKFI